MRSAVESSKSDSSCILFYNPYSIVKELPIAKTGAELRLSTVLTADSRGLFSAAWMVVPMAGGADRDRTDDPLLAKQVLSQLSYSPEARRFAASAE